MGTSVDRTFPPRVEGKEAAQGVLRERPPSILLQGLGGGFQPLVFWEEEEEMYEHVGFT